MKYCVSILLFLKYSFISSLSSNWEDKTSIVSFLYNESVLLLVLFSKNFLERILLRVSKEYI